MANDIFDDSMEQFKQTFFDETRELLESVETYLEQIENDKEDLEVFNGIFRAAHSIKAGAGIFDYKHLVRFTHLMEAILDLLRSGKRSASDAVIDLLFQSCDRLVDLVEAAEEERDLGHKATADLEKAMQDWLYDESADFAPMPSADVPADDTPEVIEPSLVNGYRVYFKPLPELMQKANEPILLLSELTGLAPSFVALDTSGLPDIFDIETEMSYLAWTIDLDGEVSKSAIEEVFEFVEGDCELTITPLDDNGLPITEEELAAASANSVSFGAPAPVVDAGPVSDGAGDVPAVAAPAAPTSVSSPADTAPNAASAPAMASAGGGPASATGGQKKPAPKRDSIRVDLDRIDRLVNMVGELVITQSMLSDELSNMTELRNSKLLNGIEELSIYTRELQENVMAIRMQPVKSVFSRIPRMVRDLSSKLGKKATLEMVGESTEVDKTVIEELTDPLTHMIRNSLDHGLEGPEERIEAGKPEEGTITLSAEHRAGRIIIEISDDGRGINRPKVLEKARERGIVGDEELSDDEIDNLIFAPGFSTADAVTDVSGRGVGMDVVRRNIQALGGRINLTSQPGQGSVFSLSLPLTLAVLDGMIIGVAGQKYVIPVNSIVESLRPSADQLSTLPNGTELVFIRGEYIPLIRLSSALEVGSGLEDPTKGLVVIVEAAGGQNQGLVVEALHGQQQVVIKSLEANYRSLAGISAATILGNGQVCLILDIDGLANIARDNQKKQQTNDAMLMVAAQ